MAKGLIRKAFKREGVGAQDNRESAEEVGASDGDVARGEGSEDDGRREAEVILADAEDGEGGRDGVEEARIRGGSGTVMAEFEDGGAEGVGALEEEGLGCDGGVAGEEGGMAEAIKTHDEGSEVITPMERGRQHVREARGRGEYVGMQWTEICPEVRMDDGPWDLAISGEITEGACESVAGRGRWREDRTDTHSLD